MGRFLWATFTNLEVALFLLGAAWVLNMVADPDARARFVRLPLLLPIVALVLAAIVSTLFGEYKSLGVPYIYRLIMGALVYASACEVLRGGRRFMLALATFVGAALVSAVAGLLEVAPWFNIEPWLRAFKPQPTTVGGLLRLSGTFEYANGAAVYFEMALPVLVALWVFWQAESLNWVKLKNQQKAESRTRWLPPFAFCLLLTVLLMALLLTFSRAALAGGIVALGVFVVVALLRRRSLVDRWVTPVLLRAAVLTVALTALGAILIFATQPMFRLRLTTENDTNWYKATVRAGQPAPALAVGDVVTVPVTLRNDGVMIWSANSALPVHLSYHWLSPDKSQYIFYEGARTGLPRDVNPGESVSFDAIVEAPPRAGQYYLEWDLAQEHVTWFTLKKGMVGDMTVYNIAASSASSRPKPRLDIGSPLDVASVVASDNSTVERTRLWRVALKMFLAHPLTGVGPDAFRNLYGKYAGVSSWNKNIFTNNMYVEMFANLGILGGLAFLWLTGLALWRAARNVLHRPVNPTWVLVLGATASLVAFFFHGFADYFLFATPIYVVFWFLLAVATTDDGRRTTEC